MGSSRAKLGLKKHGDARTVDLANERSDAKSLFVDVYPRAGANENYCSDVQTGDFKAKETFLATRGKLTLTLGDVRSDADFDVTMKLEGVTVRNAKGAEEVIPDATFGPIKVGWLPG